jgi:hypothetical protein
VLSGILVEKAHEVANLKVIELVSAIGDIIGINSLYLDDVVSSNGLSKSDGRTMC